MDYRLRKRDRIRSRKEIILLLKSGKRIENKEFKIILREREENSRIGVSVKKNIVNSVKRNRIRRVLKEIFRKNREKLKKDYDLFIIVKKDISSKTYHEIESAFFALLAKGKALKEC